MALHSQPHRGCRRVRTGRDGKKGLAADDIEVFWNTFPNYQKNLHQLTAAPVQ